VPSTVVPSSSGMHRHRWCTHRWKLPIPKLVQLQSGAPAQQRDGSDTLALIEVQYNRLFARHLHRRSYVGTELYVVSIIALTHGILTQRLWTTLSTMKYCRQTNKLKNRKTHYSLLIFVSRQQSILSKDIILYVKRKAFGFIVLPFLIFTIFN